MFVPINYSEKYERLRYLLELIEKQRVGTPEEIAKKFDCTEKTVHRMIAALRLLDNDIRWSKQRGTYYLEK